MAASNTRFTQNSLGQSKTPIDSDHGIYRDPPTRALYPDVSGAYFIVYSRPGQPDRRRLANREWPPKPL